MEAIINQIQKYVQNPPQLSGAPAGIVIAVALILGLIYCLAGYKAMRVLSSIIGFLLGAVVGYAIATAAKLERPVDLVVILVAAAICCLIGFFLFRAGIFAVFFLTVFVLADTLLIGYTSLDRNVIMIIAAVAGVIFGVLSCILLRPLIIVVTAAVGAYDISMTLFNKLIHIKWSSTVELLFKVGVGIVFFMIGIAVQFATTQEDD